MAAWRRAIELSLGNADLAIALFRVSAMFIAKPKGKGANRWAR
jgi:hypothetical protein